MKKFFLVITMCMLCLIGCGQEETQEPTAQDIYANMLEAVNKYNYIGMYCGTTDSDMNIVSSMELYGDLADRIYTAIYVDEDGTVYEQKVDINNNIAYVATEYGWLESQDYDDLGLVFTDFFNFVNVEALEVGDTSSNEFAESESIDYSNYYVLEEASQSEDGLYIYYSSIIINKDTYLPEYVSIQTYDKSDKSGSDLVVEDENGKTSYTNVMVTSKIYQFAFYESADADVYAEANVMPTDDIITEDEYSKQYYLYHNSDGEEKEDEQENN